MGVIEQDHSSPSRPSEHKDFERKGLLRIALVGNCQVDALRGIFDRSIDLAVTAIADVNMRGTPLFEENVRKIRDGTGFDWVLSQPVSDDFGPISSTVLQKQFGARFKKFTNVYFSGLHPDLSYFGSFGRRFVSPLGDYHSKVALMCYAKGIGPDECLLMYRTQTYEALDYFSLYERSAQELMTRDVSNDIRFSDRFLEFGRSHLPLYTTNHPSSGCMLLLAKVLAEHLGANGNQFTHDIFPSPLARSPIWPIYPEIRAAHGLQYSTDMYFYPGIETARRPMPIEQFVHESYEAYDAVGRDAFMSIGLAQQLRDLPI